MSTKNTAISSLLLSESDSSSGTHLGRLFFQENAKPKLLSTLNILGTFIGVIGSIPALFVGLSFGYSLSSQSAGLAYLFGISAYISIGSLGVVSLSRIFKTIDTSKLSGSDIQIKAIICKILGILLAMLSAIQYAYVAIRYVPNGAYMNNICAIVGFVMVTIFNYYGIDQLGRQVYSHLKPQDSTNADRKKYIIDKLENFSASLGHANNDEIMSLYGEIIESKSSIDQKLRKISTQAEQKQTTSSSTHTVVAVNPRTPYVKHIISALGYLIGAGVGFSYFVITLEAGKWIIESLHGTESSTLATQYTLATFASLGHCPLGAVGVNKRFIQIYKTILRSKNCSETRLQPDSLSHYSILFAAIVAGVFAAIPLTFVTWSFMSSNNFNLTSKVLLSIPTFVGPLAVRSEAFAQLIHDAVEVILNFSKDQTTRQRRRLILHCNYFKSFVNSADKENITEIYNMMSNR